MTKKICFIESRDFLLFPRAFNEITTLSKAKSYHLKILAFDKSGKLPKNDVYKGVKIKRIQPKCWLNIQGSLYSLNFIPFFFSLFPAAIKEKADVYHCYDCLSLIIGVIIKILMRKKVIYDAYEDWTYQFSSYKILSLMIDIIEKVLSSSTDYILTVNSFGNTLLKKLKRYNNNVVVLQNVPSLRDFDARLYQNRDLEKNYENDEIIIYVGGINREKGVFETVKAINIVHNELPNVKMLFGGNFSDNLTKREIMRYIKLHKLSENIEFLGFIPYEEVPPYLRLAIIGIIPYQPTSWHLRTKASSKLYLYMCSSVPIVASDFPGFREIIEKESCGILVNPTDPNELSDAIIHLIKNKTKCEEMGKKGRKAIEEKYNWEKEERKLLYIYKNL